MITVVVYDESNGRLRRKLDAVLISNGAEGHIKVTEMQFDAQTNGEAGIVVVAPGYNGTIAVSSDVLIIPVGFVDCNDVEAREIVTYGMNPRATLSYSSVSEDRCMLEIRREIITADGARIDECEIAVPQDDDTEMSIAVYGTLIVCGLLTDRHTVIHGE